MRWTLLALCLVHCGPPDGALNRTDATPDAPTVDAAPVQRGAYEVCGEGDQCPNGLECLWVGSASICTRACNSQCPPPGNTDLQCATGQFGEPLCAVTCGDGGACPEGTTCRPNSMLCLPPP